MQEFIEKPVKYLLCAHHHLKNILSYVYAHHQLNPRKFPWNYETLYIPGERISLIFSGFVQYDSTSIPILPVYSLSNL